MRNVGNLDRAVRALVGLGLLALGWSGAVAGTPGLVLKIVGFVPLATAAVGFCPLYPLAGVSTRRKP